MKKIILASASPRRSELMKQVGMDFDVIASNIEETVETGKKPHEIAIGLSFLKAQDVAKRVRDECLVIGADTIVVSNHHILGKPSDVQEAFGMIKLIQGRWHDVITGVSLVDNQTFRSLSNYVITKVKMRDLSDDEILAYVETGEPMDKAGAYGIQGLGALLVERIEGCFYNVVGLPLSNLNTMLKNFYNNN